MLTKKFFSKNRLNFSKYLKDNSIAVFFSKDQIIKGDSEFFDFADINLFYFTGLEQTNTKYFLWKNKKNIEEFLFIEKSDIKKEVWEGKKIDKREAKKISRIKNIHYLDEFEEIFFKYFENAKSIYFVEDKKYNNFLTEYEQFIRKIKRKKTQVKKTYLNSLDILKDLREIKSEEEIDEIKKAIKITKLGFDDVLKNLKKSQTEKEVEANLTYNYTKKFAAHSYHPIVASGVNSCTLHYIKNDKKLKKGELILIDSGAEINNYKSDITRTYPISGKFNKRQREVYQACFDVQKYAIFLLRPKLMKKDWELKVHIFMAEKLKDLKLLMEKEYNKISKCNSIEQMLELKEFKKLKKYYPHSTGHFLGLDTHDVGNYNEPFKENQVITVEPGIYIKEEKIGVRIEDNILITKTGCKNLSKDIAKEVNQIEF